MVALSASRLVCSAIAVMSLTTSPMRAAAFDSSPMRDVGLHRLLHGFGGDLARRLHLTADLADRGGHLLGGGGDRLDIGGGFLGSGRHHAGELLGIVGGLGQGAGGGLELGRGGRYRLDDGADRGLELVGELAHGRLAGGFLALRGRSLLHRVAFLGGLPLGGEAGLGFLLLGLHLFHPHQIVAERAGGACGIADLVAVRRIRNFDRLVAAGEREQHLGDAADRLCDRERTEHRRADQDEDDEEADAEADTGRLGDRRFGLLGGRFPGLGGDTERLVHQLVDRGGRRAEFLNDELILLVEQRYRLIDVPT